MILSIPEMLKQLGNFNMLMFGESLGRAGFEFDGGACNKKQTVRQDFNNRQESDELVIMPVRRSRRYSY